MTGDAQETTTGSPANCSVVDEAAKARSHADEFASLTGMSPRRCFRLLLVVLSIRTAANCWTLMVALEYFRYYVSNDLRLFSFLKAATSSPIHALQAFIFPFWGVAADRVSRKQVLVVASITACASSWLYTAVPSLLTFVLAHLLPLIIDLSIPVGEAMFRDIFTAEEWETSNGGATGIKARVFFVTQMVFLGATVVGMSLLKLGERGVGLPNEYQLHKAGCSESHCLPWGHSGIGGFWRVDGCLRLIMIMSSLAKLLDVFVVVFLIPETLRPRRGRESLCDFVRGHWRKFWQPWNNLRVLATHQLRFLMAICVLDDVLVAGLDTMFLSVYSRFSFDSFTMAAASILSGITGWLTAALIPCSVVRHGDLRGVWVPKFVLALLFAVACAALPPGYGHMIYLIFALFKGPAEGLSSVTNELLSKQIPKDVQGTYQTATAVVERLVAAIFTWPWNRLFVRSQQFEYPLDGLPLLVGMGVNSLALGMTLWKLRDDPRGAIMNGKALEGFWETPYARGKWYQYHSGGVAAGASDVEQRPS